MNDAELMLLGFISLLLTVSEGLITRICIPEDVADTWHPCSEKEGEEEADQEESETTDRRRRLLAALFDSGMPNPRRVLAAGGGSDKCTAVCKTQTEPDIFLRIYGDCVSKYAYIC